MTRSAIRGFLNRSPRLKTSLMYALRFVMPSLRVSSHYVESTDAEIDGQRLRDAWQNQDIPLRQRSLVEKELSHFRRGEPVVAFDVLTKCLKQIRNTQSQSTLLEIGCSSGYYSEVIQSVAPGITYTGCDYSEPFIDMAKRTYPALAFHVEDATALSYANSAFDTVVSGCCLLHIPEHRTAIAETARVTRSHAIFHRTPVLIGLPTKCFVKRAYGIETVEYHFNETEFLSWLDYYGLDLVATHSWGEEMSGGTGKATRTYVCKKRAAA